MKTFTRLILEETMDVATAMKIFGYTKAVSKDQLKKDYRVLAMKNHPDHGGSVTKMSKINVAYEVLAKQVGSNGTSTEEDKRDALKEVVCLKCIQLFKDQAAKMPTLVKKICDHFTALSNGKFTFNGTYSIYGIDWSTAPDSNIWAWAYNKKNMRRIWPFAVDWDVNIENPTKDVVFKFEILTNVNFPQDNALDSSFETPIKIKCTSVVNTRKQIVFDGSWKNTQNSDSTKVFNKPEEVFNNDKIKKILNGGGRTKSNSKFTKKDAEAHIVNILGGEMSGLYKGSVQIPIIKHSITKEEFPAYGFTIPKFATDTLINTYLQHGTFKFDMRRVVVEKVPFWVPEAIVITDIVNGTGLMKQIKVNFDGKYYKETEELFLGLKRAQQHFISTVVKDSNFESMANTIIQYIKKECKNAEIGD